MSATAIEQAWKTLEDAGVVTPADRALLEARARERAVSKIAQAIYSDMIGQFGSAVEAVQIVITDRTIVADQSGVRAIPRLVRPARPKADKADGKGKTETGKAEAKASGDAGDIPTEFLRRATEELGGKWFGRQNALRSARVVARARELAAAG